MKRLILSILPILALPLASAQNVLFETSFEGGEGGQYNVPPSWVEDQPRAQAGGGFGTSGRDPAKSGLTPIDGSLMARVSMIGDTDPSTSFSGTISTTLTETFAANSVYELKFYVARDGYVTTNQWFALGGLRANGTDVASADVEIRSFNSGAGAEDVFYPVNLTFSTIDNPEYIGDTISIYLGMRHEGEHQKSLYFDDVTLTATVIPEPSTYAAILGALGLLGVVLLRRRK